MRPKGKKTGEGKENDRAKHLPSKERIVDDCNLTLSDKLQKVQNSTARAIYHYQVQI